MGEPLLSVVVPTLNAAAEIGGLLDSLSSQTLRPAEVLVADSSSDDGTADLARSRGARVVEISRADFNHGSTRDVALRLTCGDVVCFLTQDAVPASARYLERLVAPMLADEGVALASGRQLPKAGARSFERLVRAFSYPAEPSVRSEADLPRLGIRTFLASDVCSAYRRGPYLECGGFPAVETNEDMLMAARLVGRGYRIAYAADACVYHSHNLTPRQQFERNRAVGRFLEEHSAELMGASELGEGGRLARSVASGLLREGKPGELLAFLVDCAARLAGNRAGRMEARRDLKGKR